LFPDFNLFIVFVEIDFDCVYCVCWDWFRLCLLCLLRLISTVFMTNCFLSPCFNRLNNDDTQLQPCNYEFTTI